jgi:hypothetical protein
MYLSFSDWSGTGTFSLHMQAASLNNRDLKLSLGSQCKILILGMFVGINLIILDDVLKSMLIPSGPFRNVCGQTRIQEFLNRPEGINMDSKHHLTVLNSHW